MSGEACRLRESACALRRDSGWQRSQATTAAAPPAAGVQGDGSPPHTASACTSENVCVHENKSERFHSRLIQHSFVNDLKTQGHQGL